MTRDASTNLKLAKAFVALGEMASDGDAKDGDSYQNAFSCVVENGDDGEIKFACYVIANAILGRSRWNWANGGEAAVADDGSMGVDFCGPKGEFAILDTEGCAELVVDAD